MWPQEKTAGQIGPAGTRPYEQKLLDPVSAWKQGLRGKHFADQR
jgi:hypothetical protein